MKMIKRGTWMVALSFLLALMFLIMPLPDAISWLRPQVTMLVLIYWVIYLPERVGVGIGWFVGLLMDVLQGTILGEYALGMALIAYLAYRLHTRIRMYPVGQQMFSVLIFVGLAQMIAVWVNYFTGQTNKYYLQWLPILTTTLCWPVIYLLLKKAQNRFSIE